MNLFLKAFQKTDIQCSEYFEHISSINTVEHSGTALSREVEQKIQLYYESFLQN